MSKFYLNLVFISFLAIFPASFLQATNYSNNGGNKSYTLVSGDTLWIQQGTYKGSITLADGAVVIVAANVIFTPSALNLWAPAGKIINNGLATVGSMGIGGGFSFENNSSLTINGDMSFYSGTAKTLINNAGATIKINGALSANDNTTINNFGNIVTTGAFSLYASSAVLSNKGSIKIGGSFNDQGQLINENSIAVAGDFNYWGGGLTNTGQIEPTGNFSIGSGLTYINTCRLITKGGINNYGTLQNYGLIWAGTSGTSSDQFTNSGTFFNAAGAKLRTANFTNYGNITGAGYFYATGVTTLGGGATIGVSGNTTDSIKVYDLTRTNASGIFDNQWGIVQPNTKYATFMAPDSIELYAGCSASFRSSSTSVALPVVFNYFYLKTINKQPILYWSAEYEKDMKFIIERSFDGSHFSDIRTTTSNITATYSFIDETVGSQAIAYYRIRGISAKDGSNKTTGIKVFKLADAKAAISVYPNPTRAGVSINYSATSPGTVLVRVQNISGQQMVLKNASVVIGENRIEVVETNNLPTGVYTIDLIKGNEMIASEKFVKQ